MVFLARNIGNNFQVFNQYQSLYKWGVFYKFSLNGLGVYTTWTVIASLINLTTAIVYTGEGDPKVASLVALSLLVIFHITWFIIENFRVDFYARSILTPYLVVIWASNGVYQNKKNNPEVPEVIKQFVLAILIIAAITFIVRVAIVTFRNFKKPLKGIDLS